MDYFDFDTINDIIISRKKELLCKVESLDINEKNMVQQSDLLCQVLDFSPKIEKDFRNISKIVLKNNVLYSEKTSKEKEETKKEEQKTSATPLTDQEKIVKIIIKEIIDKVLESISNASNKSSDEDDSEDEDEYERLMERRKQELERRQGGTSQSIKQSISKIANLFNESNKIRVYYSGKNFIDQEISSTDTVLDLKISVLDYLKKNHKMELKYSEPEAYEIRLADDDNGIPNLDFPALEDKANLVQSKNNVLSFREIENYTPDKSGKNKKNKLLGDIKGVKKFNIKIYFKIDKPVSSSKIIEMNENDTLKTVLQWILKRDLLGIRNIDLYYFVEHSEKVEDMDSALSMDTVLKDLKNLELDLLFKKFPDAPDSTTHDTSETKEDINEDENGREYIFNEISAGKLQEFEVVKINKYKNKQERVLGIDMYNIYNTVRKGKQGMLSKLFKEKTKKPQRKIKDIKDCKITGDKRFSIEIKPTDNDPEKTMIFEVKNNNIRNEIVSKLQFLIKLNQES